MFFHESSENTAANDGAKYDSAKYNDRSFSTLIRALRLSQGYSSFVLVNCNSLALRQQIVDQNLQPVPRNRGNCCYPNRRQLSTGQSRQK